MTLFINNHEELILIYFFQTFYAYNICFKMLIFNFYNTCILLKKA